MCKPYGFRTALAQRGQHYIKVLYHKNGWTMQTENETNLFQIGDMLRYDKSHIKGFLTEYFIVTDITFINGWPVQYDLMQLDDKYNCKLPINSPAYKRYTKIS